MKDVMILTGAGQIGMAIARRMGYGMKIVIGDKKTENAQAIAKIMNDAGFDAVPVEMDLSSRDSILNLIAEAQKYGEISMLVNAAGVSPSQASIETILKVDLYGTAVLLQEVGKVIKEGGVGVTISSQSGWRMPALTAGKMNCWQQLQRKNCSNFPCYNRRIFGIPCTLIRWRNAAMKSALCQKQLNGANGAPGSMRLPPALL